MPLDREIRELLYRHDCVIVPRFGGFLTHYRPARLDEARRMIHPPGKDLSFNRHLVRNDGLLADHLARHEGLTFELASERMDDVVAGWARHLAQHGRLELKDIGTFYHDVEKNLQFEPDKRSNFLREAYGLKPVAAVPIEKERPVLRTLPPAETKALQEDAASRSTPLLWVAAATALLLFGAGAWYAYTSGMPDGPQWSGIVPLRGQDRSYTPRMAPLAPAHDTATEEEAVSWPEPGNGITSVLLDPTSGSSIWVDAGIPALEEAEPDKTSVVVPEVRSRFHIIGGCFSMEENAERFVEHLNEQGFDARIIDHHKGLYRVAFGSFPDKGTALDALTAIRSDGSNQAWLLVK